MVIILFSGLIYLLRQGQKPQTAPEKTSENLDKNVVTHSNSRIDQRVATEKETIDCPYCLEEIYAGAIKCKHCKSFLEKDALDRDIEAKHKPQSKLKGEEDARGNNVDASFKERRENNYATKLRPEDEKTIMMGILVLFVAQNSFFIDISSGELKYIVDDNIVSYVGTAAYTKFINNHKKERETLLDGNQSLTYYAKRFIPAEPEIYPTSVDVAQKQYPHLLLDIVTLELQYYLCLAVAMTIDKTDRDIGKHFFSYYIQCLKLAGWSENGLIKVMEIGVKRYDEYALQLSLNPNGRGLYDLGSLSSTYIFNSKDYNSISYLTACFTGLIENFGDAFDSVE